MSGIFSILHLGREALYVSQTGIQVAGNNIANVNTEGYSRQRTVIEEGKTLSSLGGKGLIGTGAVLQNITSIRDTFLDNQILQQKQTYGMYSTKNDIYQQIEVLFDTAKGTGINDAIDNFFNAFSDLSNNPEGYAERMSAMELGTTMASSFNETDTYLRQLRSDTNSQVRATVLKINEITEEVAKLNEQIHETETGNQVANDFRDRRSTLLEELSQMIDVNYFENDEGQAFIYTDTGRSLVLGSTAYDLKVTADANNNDYYNVELETGSGTYADISSEITAGSLVAYLEMRDTILPDVMDKMDQLAAGIINEVNILHSQGYGLDGSTGINFFDPLSPGVSANADNAGSGAITYVGMDQSSTNRDNFEIRFTDASTYTIYNTTDGEAVSTGNTYTSGADITFEGITVNISGSVSSGDVFSVKASANAARDMAVNSTIVNNVNKIAAAQDVSSLPGDNQNALDISALKSALTMTNDTSSFGDFYTAAVSAIGIDISNNSFNTDQQEAMVDQLVNRREGISGVSLDEEAIDLIKFQSAYEAAANLISVTSEMLDVLVSLLK
jgi:flagellar hook-associated protein 1 FlgK